MNPQQQETPVPGLEALARERQPSRDLWAGIEMRIAQPSRGRRREPAVWPYALAASVCLAVLAGVLLRGQPPAPREAAALQTAQREPEPAVRYDSHPYSNTSDESLAAAELSPRTLRMLRSESLDNAPALVAERAETSGLMKATYSAGSGRNARSQQAILRANLKLVSQAEREVRRALKTDPDSTSLQSLLVVAQEKRAVITALLVHEQD
ncbi:MAG: hypothetical protein Q7J29_02165 [Stagnimonas sp.]|nr:hypothetical protein [Stagnimonas sp.]